MLLYLLKELACCAIVAVTLAVFIGGCLLTWRVGRTLAGGIWQTGARLAHGRMTEAAPSRSRHTALTFPSVLRPARSGVGLELNSNTE